MAAHCPQRRRLLLHLCLFGLPHVVVAFVVVGLCLREVLHQYGGPGDALGWAAAWFATAGFIVITWLTLAVRGWLGGAAALRAASLALWLGLSVAMATTAIAWTGLLQTLFHADIFAAPALSVALVLLTGIPLLGVAVHLLWLRSRPDDAARNGPARRRSSPQVWFTLNCFLVAPLLVLVSRGCFVRYGPQSST